MPSSVEGWGPVVVPSAGPPNANVTAQAKREDEAQARDAFLLAISAANRARLDASNEQDADR